MADNKNRLESILSRFDADWTASDEARREAKNDLFFSRVSQWDDWLSQYTTLQYRGQFDVVRPVVRKLVSEMRQNPIDVLYRPKDGASPDAADVLMGMYRTDMRHNTAKIAVNAIYADEANKLQNTRLKNVIMKGDLTPEVVNNMLFSKNKSEVQNLYRSVGQVGRAQMRNGIIGKAMEKSGGSPDQFLRQINLMSNQTGIAFKGRDAAYLKGIKNYLEATKRAGQAGVTTPTGQQTIPFILGIGTVTNPALVGVGGGYGLLARMYESEPARNAMLRLANTPRGSTAFEKALAEVERAVNYVAQGAKSDALSE
ncbi:hypothetical protein ZX71_002378 [Salmonella enterica subsp. enterica]|nr:hypothetical protein [Salmonella enterica subsp. enterica serovar Javiana]EDW0164471.1 hypothetical protein [Salmonella enterica subsp. enterica serovar Javiana]